MEICNGESSYSDEIDGVEGIVFLMDGMGTLEG